MSQLVLSCFILTSLVYAMSPTIVHNDHGNNLAEGDTLNWNSISIGEVAPDAKYLDAFGNYHYPWQINTVPHFAPNGNFYHPGQVIRMGGRRGGRGSRRTGGRAGGRVGGRGGSFDNNSDSSEDSDSNEN